MRINTDSRLGLNLIHPAFPNSPAYDKDNDCHGIV